MRPARCCSAESSLESARDQHLHRPGIGAGYTVPWLCEVYARPASGATSRRSAGQRRRTYPGESSFCGSRSIPKTGCITSLINKKTSLRRIAAGGCGNQLQAFEDTPKDYDAWNIDADFDKVFTNLDMVDSVSAGRARCAPRGRFALRGTGRASTFVQDITLYTGWTTVDVVIDIDWHERHILLKAAFRWPLQSAHATFEIPYGTIERPTTRNNSVEKAKFEVPAMRWADLGDQAARDQPDQ